MNRKYAEAIDNYWNNVELGIPRDESLCVLVPSASDYVDQRLVDRKSGQIDRRGELARFIQKIGTLSGNLNFKRSKADWKKFYTFPSVEDAQKYAMEGKLSVNQIVNFNESAPNNLAQEIIFAMKMADHRSAKLTFLRGTTGVGKTTFLKYFSKFYREYLFSYGVVISRVRFRDIQDYITEHGKADEESSFRRVIVNCLVRDICACANFDLEKVQDVNDEMLVKARENQEDIRYKIDEAILTGNQFSKLSVDQLIDRFERDDEAILDLEEGQKAGFVESFKENLGFSIVLDGFDAMRPEEIALFDDHSQALFFNCLSTVTRNAFARDNPTGRCLKKINKHFIIAARQITIAQLKDEIEPETDNNQIFLEDYHVIGTSISRLLSNRIEVHYSGDLSKSKIRRLQTGIENSIDYIMRLLRSEHPSIQEGRFIDLFNHNIREKVRFLADFIDLLTFKIEQRYRYEFSSIPDDSRDVLDISKLILYLEDLNGNLGIEIYEVQKLLILNKYGYFKNFFHHNVKRELIPETERGQFDNIFNYENRQLFLSEHELNQKQVKYEFARDPLLEKFFILYRLSQDDGLAEPVLNAWFSENFTYTRCRGPSLRQLIRSGLVIADYVDDVIHLNLTSKGAFFLKELIGVSVYLEHVVLNVQVPHFVSQLVIKPKDSRRRAWGRNSITNITLFLKYVEMVARYSIRRESDSLRNEVITYWSQNVRQSVKQSFFGIIAEGLQNEDRSDYATDLSRELATIGIDVPAVRRG